MPQVAFRRSRPEKVFLLDADDPEPLKVYVMDVDDPQHAVAGEAPDDLALSH